MEKIFFKNCQKKKKAKKQQLFIMVHPTSWWVGEVNLYLSKKIVFYSEQDNIYQEKCIAKAAMHPGTCKQSRLNSKSSRYQVSLRVKLLTFPFSNTSVLKRTGQTFGDPDFREMKSAAHICIFPSVCVRILGVISSWSAQQQLITAAGGAVGADDKKRYPRSER